MRLLQGNSLLTSLLLLFQQGSRKRHNKYHDVERNLSSNTGLAHAFAGHMERQLHAVAGSGAAAACGNRTHRMAAPKFRHGLLRRGESG